MGERRVHAAVLVVVEDEVAVGERAALRVLSRQANRGARDEQTAQREPFRLRPVDPSLLAEGLAPSLELLYQLGMDRETLRHGEELLVQLARKAKTIRELEGRKSS